MSRSRPFVSLIHGLVVAALSVPMAHPADPAPAPDPCRQDAKHRAFDFWVGEWVVKNKAGKLAGHSKIEEILGGCVVLENWSGARGMTGKSLNSFNASTASWQQTWMDDRGGVIEFIDGALDASGRMRFGSSRPVVEEGKSTLHRLTFAPLPDGRVEQTGEVSSDGGKSWTEEYDLFYEKAK